MTVEREAEKKRHLLGTSRAENKFYLTLSVKEKEKQILLSKCSFDNN